MRALSLALRKARTLTTFSALEVAFVLPAFLLLGLARLAILLLPFRVYARHFGAVATLKPAPSVPSEADLKRARSVGRVVRSVANVTPWASLCLAQAMVAALLLRLIDVPYCVFFGVAPTQDQKNANPLDAHAWIMTGDAAVTGGRGHRRFTVVQVFERDKRKLN